MEIIPIFFWGYPTFSIQQICFLTPNKWSFLTFPADFYIPKNFSNLNYNCFIFLNLRNLQEQVKKEFCYQKLFWPFTVWINCSSDLKNFANSRPLASNSKKKFSITRTILVTKYHFFQKSPPRHLNVDKSKRFYCFTILMLPRIYGREKGLSSISKENSSKNSTVQVSQC